MVRYRIYRSGPDDRSTYVGCWGVRASSRGRLVASVPTATAALAAVAREGGWAGLDAYAWTGQAWTALTRRELEDAARAERWEVTT